MIANDLHHLHVKFDLFHVNSFESFNGKDIGPVFFPCRKHTAECALCESSWRGIIRTNPYSVEDGNWCKSPIEVVIHAKLTLSVSHELILKGLGIEIFDYTKDKSKTADHEEFTIGKYMSLRITNFFGHRLSYGDRMTGL